MVLCSLDTKILVQRPKVRIFFYHPYVKMFLKHLWEGKMHGGTKLAFFIHFFVSECLANQPTTVLELGLSVALFELNRTILQDFIAFL